MRFALLALPFALIGAAAAAAVRSENLVESSLQGRQLEVCLAYGESCRTFEDLCCGGLLCQDLIATPCPPGRVCPPSLSPTCG
ncbi:hypothetical protein B0H14DRAFT_2682307 [Mycena olivaceomarginata]|nr:hypothetical protein B0H14DRAFT_2682307 [Mycena olivaceomarginata]